MAEILNTESTDGTESTGLFLWVRCKTLAPGWAGFSRPSRSGLKPAPPSEF